MRFLLNCLYTMCLLAVGTEAKAQVMSVSPTTATGLKCRTLQQRQ